MEGGWPVGSECRLDGQEAAQLAKAGREAVEVLRRPRTTDLTHTRTCEVGEGKRDRQVYSNLGEKEPSCGRDGGVGGEGSGERKEWLAPLWCPPLCVADQRNMAITINHDSNCNVGMSLRKKRQHNELSQVRTGPDGSAQGKQWAGLEMNRAAWLACGGQHGGVEATVEHGRAAHRLQGLLVGGAWVQCVRDWGMAHAVV